MKALDPVSTMVLFEGGNVRAFERRWKRVVCRSDGIPRATIPDGVGLKAMLTMIGPGEHITNMWVLVPVTPTG